MSFGSPTWGQRKFERKPGRSREYKPNKKQNIKKRNKEYAASGHLHITASFTFFTTKGYASPVAFQH
jgi:hypothetical protein